MTRRPYALAPALLTLLACGSSGARGHVTRGPTARHSSSIALSADQSTLFVVSDVGDAVSVIDVEARKLVREVQLTKTPPRIDAKGNFYPTVEPRYLAESPGLRRVYVAGHRSGRLYVIDEDELTVLDTVELCAEPAGVLVSSDEASIYVACAQEGEVVRVDARSLKVGHRSSTEWKPWALAFTADETSLLVTHLLGPGVTALDAADLSKRARWEVADGPATEGEPRMPHGPSRGLYDLAVRPGTTETWLAHMMLGIDTPQPELNFENTVFPALSVFAEGGAERARLSVRPQDVVGSRGAFGDVVSGPHALAFTPDGAFALVVDASSEDVLVVDARTQVEVDLVRPLPGHMPDGIAMSADGSHAYVFERSSSDVAVLAIERSSAGAGIDVHVDGAAIPTTKTDPMPKQMREGQHLFYSANSDEAPITTDHWVACSSCHIEARSDAVTWRFAAGPRDTPSNAGGLLDTGFLLRTAARRTVQEYWHTIQVEQGGKLSPDDPTSAAQLDAIAAFVNHAVPPPVPPRTDQAKVARGRVLFTDAEVGCATCHVGPAYTDSGLGNRTRDYGGRVVLHDVGTCVKTGFPDVAHEDLGGHPRAACDFDTPSLRGVSDSAPYLHDGSARTLRDVLEKTRGRMGNISGLSDSQLDDLVEFMRSL